MHVSPRLCPWWHNQLQLCVVPATKTCRTTFERLRQIEKSKKRLRGAGHWKERSLAVPGGCLSGWEWPSTQPRLSVRPAQHFKTFQL